MPPIVAGAATSAGRVRAVNEDSFHVGAGMFAIADGMGGQAGGQRASQLAIERLVGLVGDRSPRPDHLLAAVSSANDAILEEADQEPARRGMGTTLVGLTLVELAGSPHWLVFNVGDSRVYT